MKVRLFGIFVTLLLIAAFGFGVFLLVVAKETPAPGLILMLISGWVLLQRRHRTTASRPADSTATDDAFAGIEQARESYEYDMERRRRGDFDTDTDTHTTRQ